MPTSADIANQLAKYDASRKSSADVLNEAMGQYGIPELRGRVSGLRTTLTNTESALNAVDPSVTGRTSRSLVTEAQRRGIVAKEREPLAEQYSGQASALSTESANLSSQEAAAKLLAEQKIGDYTAGRQALQDQYSMASAAEQAAEARRQYNESLAEQRRQADKPTTTSTPKYKVKTSDNGGLNFYNESGAPITAAQYVSQMGGTIVDLLSASGDPGDAKIISDINSGMSYKDLKNKYPYVFGGV